MASFRHTFTSGQSVTPARLNDARDVFDIVNADIKSDAAIAGTKVAPNFGSQNVVTTGAVGAGVTSGTYKLTAAHSATDGGWLHGASTASYLSLGGFTGASDGAFRLNFERSTGLITFSGGTRDTPVSRMVIDNVGNVGIGTGNPNAKLQVAGVIRAEAVGGQGGRIELLNVANTAVHGLFDVDASDTLRVISLPAAALSFGTNSTERMRITEAGNVGIGVSSIVADHKLHVAGPVLIRGAVAGTTAAMPSETTMLSVVNGATYGGTPSVSVSIGASNQDAVDNNEPFQYVFTTPSTSAGAALVISARTFNGVSTYTRTERMRIANNGFVGINTNSPSHRLDVNGVVNTSDAYRVDGTEVVSNRVTGWGTPTGTISRSALTVTAAATYSQSEMNTVIQALKAVITDLRTHGLIGN